MSDREPVQPGNIATPEYLDALWLEALRWPESETVCPGRRFESPMRCPRCGEECWRMWNNRARRREYLCLEVTCGFHWWQHKQTYKVMEVQRGV